jgi:hypothetical protein
MKIGLEPVICSIAMLIGFSINAKWLLSAIECKYLKQIKRSAIMK